jgi:hypothetical protein
MKEVIRVNNTLSTIISLQPTSLIAGWSCGVLDNVMGRITPPNKTTRSRNYELHCARYRQQKYPSAQVDMAKFHSKTSKHEMVLAYQVRSKIQLRVRGAKGWNESPLFSHG